MAAPHIPSNSNELKSVRVELPKACYSLKTMLINPKHAEWGNTPPLGIGYLAAVLEKNNLPVSVVDMSAYRMSIEEVKQKLKEYAASIIGISATTPQMVVGLEIARIAKEVNPSCKVVFGGPHPTAMAEDVLENPNVDFVVRGEGEMTLLDLILALGGGKKLENVYGLSFKKDDRAVSNPPRPLIANLDVLPFPARHLFPFPQAYSSPMLKRRIFADIMTSRGCIGHCIFCNRMVFGRTVRMMSPEYVINEIEHLIANYGVGELHLADDLFAYDVDRASKICDMIIERKLDIVWSASGGMRVDGYTKDLLKKMRSAGCYRVHFGVESGSDEILTKIGKGTNREQIRQAFSDAKEAGMITVAAFMLGNYGENKETMEETIKFSKSIKADYCQFMMAVPFPGSAYYVILDKNKQILTKDWAKYEMFSDPIFETEDLNKTLMVKMWHKAHRAFFFRPEYIWKRTLELRSWSDVRSSIVGGIKALQRTVYKA